MGGEVLAEGSVDFVDGKPPGVELAVTLPQMSLSHVKQLWPFIAAGNARRWAMANLFDGQITNGRLQYRVPPGRIGNGVPLSGDEVSGHIDIANPTARASRRAVEISRSATPTLTR